MGKISNIMARTVSDIELSHIETASLSDSDCTCKAKSEVGLRCAKQNSARMIGVNRGVRIKVY